MRTTQNNTNEAQLTEGNSVSIFRQSPEDFNKKWAELPQDHKKNIIATCRDVNLLEYLATIIATEDYARALRITRYTPQQLAEKEARLTTLNAKLNSLKERAAIIKDIINEKETENEKNKSTLKTLRENNGQLNLTNLQAKEYLDEYTDYSNETITNTILQAAIIHLQNKISETELQRRKHLEEAIALNEKIKVISKEVTRNTADTEYLRTPESKITDYEQQIELAETLNAKIIEHGFDKDYLKRFTTPFSDANKRQAAEATTPIPTQYAAFFFITPHENTSINAKKRKTFMRTYTTYALNPTEKTLRDIFGTDEKPNSTYQISTILRRHALENPNGASSKTMQQFGIPQDEELAKIVAEYKKHAVNPSAKTWADILGEKDKPNTIEEVKKALTRRAKAHLTGAACKTMIALELPWNIRSQHTETPASTTPQP